MSTYVLLFIIAVMASTAQIIMKYGSILFNQRGTLFHPHVITVILISLSVSFLGQILWFHALKSAKLSTSYLFLSVAFVIVPTAGAIIFGEKLGFLHAVAMLLIVIGVITLGFAEN